MATITEDERDELKTGGESGLSRGVSDGEVDERFDDITKAESGSAGGGKDYVADLKERHPDPRQLPSKHFASSWTRKLRKRGGLLAIGGLGFLIVAILIAFFLFLLGFKLRYIKTLFMDYQFASFHIALSKRMDHLVTEDAILSDESGKLPDGSSPSLYERLRGWSPNEGLKALGKEDVKLEFEDKSLGRRGKLQAIEDTSTGEKFWRKGFAPDGAPPEKVLSSSEFTLKVKEIINAKLYNESGFFRRKTFGDVADRGGLKLNRFTNWLKDKFKGKDPTTEEASKELIKEEINDAGKLPTDNGDLRSIADDAATAASEGKSTTTIRDRIKSSLTDTETLSKVSLFVGLTTFYCIFNDIFNHMSEALNTRIDNMMKIAAQEFTIADEQAQGKAPTAVVNAENKNFDGFEKTAAYQRANGQEVTQPDLPQADRPQTILGFLPDQVTTFMNIYKGLTQSTPKIIASGGLCLVPGISNACDNAFNFVVNKGCSVILNPYVQGGLVIGEVASAILTVGTDEAGLQVSFRGFEETVPQLFKLGKGLAIGAYIFGEVIPGLIEDIAGISGAGLKGAADRTNRLDAGTNLIKNEMAVASGAHKVSTPVAVEQANRAIAIMREQDKAKGPAYALLNLNNTRSLASRALVSLPTTPRAAMAAMSNVFAAIMSPGKLIALLSEPASAKQAVPLGDDAFYGIQQYSWEDSEVDGTKSGFDFISNSRYVEGKLSDLQAKYAKCFSRQPADRLIPNDKYKDCDDSSEDFRHYGMYVLDCYSVEQITSSTTDEDTFKQSQCSKLVGVTDGPVADAPASDAPGNPSDAPAPPTKITGNVYLLGDSISVRANSGGLVSDMSKVDISLTINADVARSLTVPGQATHTTAEQVVDIDHDKIASAKAIVIEMGTNQQTNFSAEQTKLIQKIRTINALAPLYWVNVGSTGYPQWSDWYPAYANTTNDAIDSNASVLGYAVIDWCRTMFGTTPCVITATHPTNGLMDRDGMHPTIPAGVTAFKNMLIQALTNPVAATQ